jgi:3-oxoacyl-[acyl-carrier protein] reductase
MLLHSTRGSLVHLSSVSVQRGFRGLAMYAATKAAMEGFSKGVAREWGRMGIRSNCVVPGFMETDMSAELDERQREQVFRRTALGEATSVASVARTIRFLLSDEASSVTGTNIAVDAGA